jgi:hypothetical protein
VAAGRCDHQGARWCMSGWSPGRGSGSPAHAVLDRLTRPRGPPALMSSMNAMIIGLRGRALRCSYVKPPPASCGVAWMGLPALSVQRRHGGLRKWRRRCACGAAGWLRSGSCHGPVPSPGRPRRARGSALGDSDHMQGCVGQPVPAPVEPHLALAGT